MAAARRPRPFDVTTPSRCIGPDALGIGGHPPAPRPVPQPFSLVDLQRRRVAYLRVSVTDRCNFRCTYCMPADGVQVAPRADLLDFDEIATLVRHFVALGVTKVRLTGGEPLVRRDIVELVRKLAAIEGIEDLSMTTNGDLLGPLAAPLREAGLQRLNVSLDTLRPETFTALTRTGSLDGVLAGLQAADRAGFADTKINAVVLRGLNDHDLHELAAFCAERAYVLRCIEYMPIGLDQRWGPETFVPSAEVRALLGQRWHLQPDPAQPLPGGGPATRWRADERAAPHRSLRMGFISAVSEKFCELCNRVRLSPTGTLRECLSTAGALSLRDLLRAGRSGAEIEAAIRDALLGKVDGHRFDAAEQTPEAMSSIGG